MDIILIKRGRVIHCGISVLQAQRVYKISLCNGIWTAKDKTSVGKIENVTCKRCLKILAKADENGFVNLSKKKKRGDDNE